MTTAKVSFVPGDRVRRGEQVGTVIYFHNGSKDKDYSVSVLLDDLPRSAGSKVWRIAEVEKIGVLTSTCPVCGEHHLIYYCPLRV